jgi:hypothetical protein
MENLETAIRNHLVSYVAGELSLEAFTSWLVSASWDIAGAGDEDAAQLAYSIELALAEHSSGLLTDDELRAELQRFSEHVRLNLRPTGSRS